MDVATSAETARDAVAATLAEDADPDDARQAATAVASVVAADVVVQSKAIADAAALVGEAVSSAAEAAFDAAQFAAATVELAADMAAASGRVVAGSSAATQAATDVVVGSVSRVADLAPRLHFQPIYNLANGALTEVEALLRWQHPARGLLLPAEFLDVAESHPDLVTPVGDWVLTTAIAQAKDWRRDLGESAPKMWVNISCEQLVSGNTCRTSSSVCCPRPGSYQAPSVWRSPNASSSGGPTTPLPTWQPCAGSVCRLRSTTSAPATPPSTTCAVSRSTRSRSTGLSSRVSAGTRRTRPYVLDHRPGSVAGPDRGRGGSRDPGPIRPAQEPGLLEGAGPPDAPAGRPGDDRRPPPLARRAGRARAPTTARDASVAAALAAFAVGVRAPMAARAYPGEADRPEGGQHVRQR